MATDEAQLGEQMAQQHLSDSGSDDDDEVSASRAKRTYTILLQNNTGAPVQIVQWPVRASQHSDFRLSPVRGANFHNSVPKAGTILSPSTDSTTEPHKLGTFQGGKRFDPRHRWGWLYVDIVHLKRRVHLQFYIQTDRHGIEKALIGRTDLDSTYDNPTSSGLLGEAVRQPDGNVLFTLSPSLLEVTNTVDDSVKKASRVLSGKGVHAVSYVSSELSRCSLIIGNEARFHEYEPPEGPAFCGTFRSTKHEVEGLSEKTIGAFVETDGKSWWEGMIKVDPVSGIAKGNGGLHVTSQSTAVFAENQCLCYGFHDAGSRRSDQLYVYITPEKSSWLGDLIADNKAWLNVPFSKLALAASHDSGMFGPLDVGLLGLIQGGNLGNLLTSAVEKNVAPALIKFVVDSLELVRLKPDRVLLNMALTQKDHFASQLRIGVRFFDFRPGFCFHCVVEGVPDKGQIHHQHAMVPGCLYITFLVDILTFLVAHPQEIVFVELKSDGFVVSADKIRDGKVAIYSMIPSVEELAAVLAEARSAVPTSSSIIVASAQDLDRPIGELIEQGKRLIMVDRVHDPDAWPRSDSYDHEAYNTKDPATIIAALEKTFAESSHSEPVSPGLPARGCIYQLQATPTANIWDDVGASLTYSDSSSLLTYVKPRQDTVTYPWVASHTFQDPGNVILLNDFVDGALVEHAIAVSRQRAGL